MGIPVALTAARPRDRRAVLAWTRLAVATASRCIIALGCALLFWAAAPALLGWQPTTVLTGSMVPTVDPGDVMITRPVDTADLHKGQVVLVRDPVHRGRLLLHRFVRVRPDHRLELRGDANSSDDSTPVAAGAVVGAAVMRVPWIGRPRLWLANGQWGRLTALALVLLLAVAGTQLDRGRRAGRTERSVGGRHRAVVPPRRRLRIPARLTA